MERIPALILSKNRAPQLRLLLESLYVNATGIFDPHVIWTADTQAFETGYKKLQFEYQHIKWVREKFLLYDLYGFLNLYKDSHFALFMDDCIFYKPLRYTAQELIDLISDDTWCLSLRLGRNTTQNNPSSIQEVYSSPDFIKYKFKDHNADSNYGFCFSWDGVVYKTKTILDFFDNNDFTDTDNQWAILPQKIENFATKKRDNIKEDLICCPKESHVVCMNYNSTHPMANFRYYPLEELNEGYLRDQLIDFSSINFDNITGTHEIRPFALRQMVL